MSDNPEEQDKRITAELSGSAPYMLFDNVRKEFGGDKFAALATAETYKGRLLGHSRMVHLPNKGVLMATGNNVAYSDEMARRCVPIRIDAKVDPTTRSNFKIGNLKEWTRDNRGGLLWAALTIIQYWVAKGARRAHGGRLVSFEGWESTMGGILQCAGVSGFLSNLHLTRLVANAERNEWLALISRWWKEDALRNSADASDLFNGIIDSNKHPVPFALRGKDPEDKIVSLGRRLSGERNRTFTIETPEGQKTLVLRVRTKNHQNDYSLEDISNVIPIAGKRLRDAMRNRHEQTAVAARMWMQMRAEMDAPDEAGAST